jgi:hypothetical protein
MDVHPWFWSLLLIVLVFYVVFVCLRLVLCFSLVAASRVHPFCNSQGCARTHVVLVIDLYELLDSAT